MGLQTEIAKIIFKIDPPLFVEWEQETDYVKEASYIVANQVLTKIREVVEGQLLTDDEIDKEHNRWCMRGRIDKDELKISWRQWIAKAQLQAILKAMDKEVSLDKNNKPTNL